jgi:chemotaxis protein MotA
LLRGFIAPALFVIVFTTISILRPEFLDIPSLVLTLGGSIGVIFFSYTPRQLQELVQVSRGLLAEKAIVPQEYADELSRLTQLYRAEGLRGLEHEEPHLADRFLRRSVGMLVDLYKEEKICAVLERDLSDVSCRHEISRQILLSLSKLFPAFGLIGTLVGMVLLLHDLYTQDVQSLPAALSLAVLTTLYGAVLANVMVAPLAARLHAAATEKEIRMQLTIDWVISIARGEAATAVAFHPRSRRTSLELSRSLKDRNWAWLSTSLQR